MYYRTIESPIGVLTIAAADDGLHSILFERTEIPQEWIESDHHVIGETARQLNAYFSGKLKEFDLPLRPAGTSFQMEVWRELARIPYGETISYGSLASRIGKPKACRAIGAANHANPLPIVIPCHRVIGSGGKMVGYGGGLPVKEALLNLELKFSHKESLQCRLNPEPAAVCL